VDPVRSSLSPGAKLKKPKEGLEILSVLNGVIVGTGVGVGIGVGVAVAVGMEVGVKVSVLVAVDVGIGVLVAVDVGVVVTGVRILVSFNAGVSIAIVAVATEVGVGVGVVRRKIPGEKGRTIVPITANNPAIIGKTTFRHGGLDNLGGRTPGAFFSKSAICLADDRSLHSAALSIACQTGSILDSTSGRIS